MNCRHLRRSLQQRQVAGCPQGLRPAVRRRVYDIARSRQTHRAPIRTEQAGNGALAKSHPPHLSNEQIVNARLVIIDNQFRHRGAQFRTQQCLPGSQSGDVLDDCCPNVMLHRRIKDDLQHPITSKDLVRLLKAQLDENIDRCTPIQAPRPSGRHIPRCIASGSVTA